MLVATLALLLAPLAPPPGPAGCDEVTVVVDLGTLGTDDVAVGCAPAGDALSALQAAGHAVEGTARWGTAFVCRVDGRPAPGTDVPLPEGGTLRETCTDTPDTRAHWSLWTSTDGGPWQYAQRGAPDLDLTAGDAVGLRFGSGGTPPQASPGGSADRPAATGATSWDAAAGDAGGASSAPDARTTAVAAAALLGAAALTATARRRRPGRAPATGVHPGAWWCWAAGTAAAALLAPAAAAPVTLAATVLVATACRAPAARGLRPYVALAVLVVAVRVALRVLVPAPGGGPALVDLPSWRVGPLHVLGPVSADGLGAAVLGALPLVTVLLVTGAGAVLADPLDLLRHSPRALVPVATVLGTAVSTVDGLAGVARDARDARRLRHGSTWRLAAAPLLGRALASATQLGDALALRGHGALTHRDTGRHVRRTALLLGTVTLLGAALGAALRPPHLPPLPAGLLPVGLLPAMLCLGAVALLLLAVQAPPVAPTTHLPRHRHRRATLVVVAVACAPAAALLADAPYVVVAALPAAAAVVALPRRRPAPREVTR